MNFAEPEYFADELKNMEELMQERVIQLKGEAFEVPLKTLNLKEPIVVETGTSLDEVIQCLVENHIGCVLVVENGILKGIFTERDVIMKVVEEVKDYSMPVDNFMTPNPKVLKMDDTILQALELMHGGGYRHVPVVNEKKQPEAVVSIKDIVAYMVEFFPEDVLNLPPHPIRVGTRDREGG